MYFFEVFKFINIDYICNVFLLQSGIVLIELVFGDCCVGDKEIEIFLKVKFMFIVLYYLDLSCNCIGNDGIIMFLRLVVK